MLARVEEDKHWALCSCISWCSRCLVSENWVAMTTRHRLIMKKDPIWMDVNQHWSLRQILNAIQPRMLPMTKANGAHLRDIRHAKRRLTQFPIQTMFANSPMEMLACMLQVAEGWPPTKSRLIGGDRQNLHNLKALLGDWLSLFLSFSRL